jgi:hypothetical protein
MLRSVTVAVTATLQGLRMHPTQVAEILQGCDDRDWLLRFNGARSDLEVFNLHFKRGEKEAPIVLTFGPSVAQRRGWIGEDHAGKS